MALIVHKDIACDGCGRLLLDADGNVCGVYDEKELPDTLVDFDWAQIAGKITCVWCLLGKARTFLASVGSAQSQGTKEQTDWMIEQAREGLRQSGGHDFDA